MKKALSALVLATLLCGCGSHEVTLAPAAVQAQEAPSPSGSRARLFVGKFLDDPGEVSVLVTADAYGNVAGRGIVFRGSEPANAYLVAAGGTLLGDTLSLRLYPEDGGSDRDTVWVSAPVNGGTGVWDDRARHLRGQLAWQERTSPRMLDFQPDEGSIPEQFFLDMRDSNGIGYSANITMNGYSSEEGVYTGSWTATGPTSPNSISGGTVKGLAFSGQNAGLYFILYGPTTPVASVGCRAMPSTVGAASDLLTGSYLVTPLGEDQDFVTGLITVLNPGN